MNAVTATMAAAELRAALGGVDAVHARGKARLDAPAPAVARDDVGDVAAGQRLAVRGVALPRAGGVNLVDADLQHLAQ